MRIAVFHNVPTGGAKRALQGFVRALHTEGHTMDVFVPETARENDFLPLKKWVRTVTRFPVAQGMGALALAPLIREISPVLWASRTIRRLPALYRVHAQIASKIDRGAYDWIYLEHDEVTIAPYLLRFLKSPGVFYCQQPYRASREAIIEDLQFGPRDGEGIRQAIRRGFWRRVTQRIAAIDRENAQHAGLLLANSHYSRESILRAYGRDAKVCRIGIDPSVFKPMDLPQANTVLSVGAVMAPKGFEFIIRALARIDSKHRPAFRIIGDREDPIYRSRLEGLASTNGIRLDIRLGVDDTVLAEAYNRAKLLVYAPYLEPLGLAPLEAMACGTPVVCVAEGGVRETVAHGETGLLVGRDEADFGEAIGNLLTDEKRRERMGRAGAARVRNEWSWKACGKQFIHAVEQWLSREGKHERSS